MATYSWLSGLTAIIVMIGGVPAAGAAPPYVEGVSVQPDPLAANVSAEMLSAMRRDLKLTTENARARLVRSDWASRLQPLLKERLGKAFAGSWLGTDGQEFVVAITDRRLEGVVRASGATPKLVSRNEAQLNSLGDKLAARTKELGNLPSGIEGWVVDQQLNKVRLQVLSGARAVGERFAAEAGLAAAEVDFETVQAQAAAQLSDVKAGTGFLAASVGGGTVVPVCSTGFAVTAYPFTPQARPAYLTAGHCYAYAAVIDNPSPAPGASPYAVQGLFGPAVVGPEDDEALVFTLPGFRPVPRMDGHGQPDTIVTDGAVQPDGSVVCRSGATTGLRCGIILPGSHTAPGGGGLNPLINVKATDACALKGDSGGPVMSGTHGQGIVSRGRLKLPIPPGPGEDIEPGCAFPGLRTTYYLPLDRALSTLVARLKVVPAPRICRRAGTYPFDGCR